MPSMQRIARIVLALATISYSSLVHAQTPPDAHDSDDQAARLLYERGAEAYQAGEYRTALERFQQAYDLSHRAALLYNIGSALDRLRQDREALAAFRQFLAEVPDHPRRGEVEARVRALETTIADEDRRAAEAAERARLEREAIEAARRSAEEEAERARLAREEAERRAAEASDGLPPAIFYSVGGAAVATGVLGLVFGLRTNSLNDDYRSLAAEAYDINSGNVSSEQYAVVASARDDAQNSQRLTNVMLFSSAALTAGAVTLVFFTDWGGDEESTPATSSTRPVPVVSFGPEGGYVGISRRF